MDDDSGTRPGGEERGADDSGTRPGDDGHGPDDTDARPDDNGHETDDNHTNPGENDHGPDGKRSRPDDDRHETNDNRTHPGENEHEADDNGHETSDNHTSPGDHEHGPDDTDARPGDDRHGTDDNRTRPDSDRHGTNGTDARRPHDPQDPDARKPSSDHAPDLDRTGEPEGRGAADDEAQDPHAIRARRDPHATRATHDPHATHEPDIHNTADHRPHSTPGRPPRAAAHRRAPGADASRSHGTGTPRTHRPAHRRPGSGGRPDPVGMAHRQAHWEQHTEIPLAVASMAFLASYALRVLAPGLPQAVLDLCLAVTLAAWALFAVDYAVRWRLSGQRHRFVRKHVLDTVVLLLPLLRPLRVVKVYEAVLRRRGEPRLALHARVIAYSGLSTLLLGFAGALAVYQQERDAPGTTMPTFGDAVWWACATLTTVGYGDVTPVTPLGRLIAVGVMMIGMALLAAVTGTFASWLLQVFSREDDERPPGS